MKADLRFHGSKNQQQNEWPTLERSEKTLLSYAFEMKKMSGWMIDSYNYDVSQKKT